MLAHSLRDGGTKKKLAVLVTVDTVSADVIAQLKVCTPPMLHPGVAVLSRDCDRVSVFW